MVQFGGTCELVLTSVLVSAFSPETILCSAAASFGPFVLGFTLSSLAKASPLSPV
jgi:hypothetical protein